MEYTLPLAIVDFLPVLFTVVGFISIIRIVSSVLPDQGMIAFIGGMLVIAGGFFKAIWKLLMAISNGGFDVNWMEDGLFVFMAPGYVMFTWSIWQISRSVQGKRRFSTWLFPILFSTVLLATSYFLFRTSPGSPAWERILLSVTVLANTLSGILLVVFAFRQQLSVAGWLFILNLVGIFVLNGLARLPEQPINIQWVEEGINAISWLGFAVAAKMLYEYVTTHFGADAAIGTRLASTAQGR